MRTYRKAKQGYKYTLTALGFENNYIRARYKKLCSEYKYIVPKAWYDKGYIVEVKDNGENESEECMQTD